MGGNELNDAASVHDNEEAEQEIKEEDGLAKIEEGTVLSLKRIHHYQTPLAETNHLLDQLKQLMMLTRKQM